MSKIMDKQENHIFWKNTEDQLIILYNPTKNPIKARIAIIPIILSNELLFGVLPDSPISTPKTP